MPHVVNTDALVAEGVLTTERRQDVLIVDARMRRRSGIDALDHLCHGEAHDRLRCRDIVGD